MYRDPVIQAVIELLKANGPKDVKYIQGDTLFVNKELPPVVFVTRDRTAIKTADSANDNHDIRIVFNGVYNVLKDLDQSVDLAAGHMGLVEMFEARDSDGVLKEDTIAHVLRKNWNVQVGNDSYAISLSDETLIEYFVGVEKRGPGIITSESRLSVTLSHHERNPGI